MPKRSSKPRDLNLLAAAIVGDATTPPEEKAPVEDRRNPAAVALGRLGGLKGGRVRAERLTPEQRKEIAQKAAKARWKK